MIRTYSELITIPTFEERFRYLKLDGIVGVETFGFDRYLNQIFYKSQEWLSMRNHIIVRDCGRDLAVEGREIRDVFNGRVKVSDGPRILIHHMNPITVEDILRRSEYLLDPEYLICTVKNTHDAIHYGDESLLLTTPTERRKNDTCPWRHD